MSRDFGQGEIRSECGRAHGKLGKKNVKQLLRLEAYGKRRVVREILAEQASPGRIRPVRALTLPRAARHAGIEVRASSLGTFSCLSESGNQK
jgi:hypothetical protein